MSGLFATFNVAKRGLFAQQKAIDVTSHNNASVKIEGYSRQRAIMETSRPFAMPSINNAIGPGQLGTGVEISIIQRVRDEFIDFQVRKESSTLGMYESRDRALWEIEGVFNEPSDTAISSLIGQFFDAWQKLSEHPETSNSRTVVAQQADSLARELNHMYNKFQEIRSNTHSLIKEDVFQINGVLNEIDNLNQQIIKVKVTGQEPNDLMDKRDLLLDKLSKEFNIEIKKESFYGNDISPENIENIPEGGQTLLVRKEPKYAVSRFSYISSIEDSNENKYTTKPTDKYSGELTVNYFKCGDANKAGKSIKIQYNDLTKEQIKGLKRHIDECRVLWAQRDGKSYAPMKIEFDKIQKKDSTGNPILGEVDFEQLDKKLGLFKPDSGALQGHMWVQEDVDRYEDKINKFAKALAFSVNAIHSGIEDVSGIVLGPPNNNPPKDVDYMPFFVNNDAIKYDSNYKITNLSDALLGEIDITAGNLTINQNILNNVMEIKTRTNDDKFASEADNNMDGEGDGKRALAMAQLRDILLQVQNVNVSACNRKDFLDLMGGLQVDNVLGVKTIKSDVNGMTMDNYFKDVVDTVGIQEAEAIRMVKSQKKVLGDFEQRKNSISGVSLNEEIANLIQFQHAYSANAKIISTVDELLDVVINGLKR